MEKVKLYFTIGCKNKKNYKQSSLIAKINTIEFVIKVFIIFIYLKLFEVH